MIKYITKIFKSGWTNLKRQGFLTLATSVVIFIAVLLGTSLYIFQGGVAFLTEAIKDKIDVSIYFNEQVSREEILKIREEVSKLSEVNKASYVSPEEAYENFVKNHENDAYLESLEAIEINPFLPSLVIQTKEPSQYKVISDFFKKEEYASLVYEIDDYKRGTIIDRISDLSSGIRNIGMFLTLFLGFIAIIVTFNTLRVSIYSQREEIEIMRLVGAKNSFIRGPFLIQGSLCGLFAAILCFGFSFLLLFLLKSNIETLFMGFDMFGFYKDHIFIILLLQLLIGIGLGLISSFFAVRKYLKD
ncbi:MAG TPA: permease-like cell division protein FtsX [Candidatus Pacearchaeota archaeon]|nr:permease-like cell division protein FtsX [Candidatus Pacearchaeota archaeon]HOC53755.1 permease-like cell division protein FtsX [Candidatus Pacearchaeota archaeon]